MNLQKRIFGLHLLMLTMSLLVMLVVSVLVVNNVYVDGERENPFEFVESQVDSALSTFSGTDFSSLSSQLDEGIGLYVSQDGKEVYNDLTQDQKDLLAESLKDNATTDKQEDSSEETDSDFEQDLYYANDVILVNKYYQSYQLSFVLDEANSSIERSIFLTFLARIGLIGGLALVLILTITSYFSSRLSASLNQPLQLLQEGAQRIRQGDYSHAISYKGDQEFEELSTAFNQMQTSLLAEKEKTASYEAKRRQMVANISHDLRTPLTSIKGYSKGLLDGIANTDDKRQAYAKVIYQKSELMDALLEKLLLFSQLETDHLPFDLQETDLGAFLEAYVSEKSLEGQERGFEISYQGQGQYPLDLDSLQFCRLLDNLVDNALKYARSDHLHLNLSLSQSDNLLTLSFRDNGQGLSEQDLSHVFEAFYRADPARHLDGHGLGLAIVKTIVEGHGGQIRVKNDRGLVFEMIFSRKES